MRVTNILLAVSPIVLSIILTAFTFVTLLTAWLAFAVWLSMIVGAFAFLNYVLVYSRARSYSSELTGEMPSLRIASFVTSFNEDPEIVKATLISVKIATDSLGKVFLLDDSTKPEIRRELEEFCRKNDIVYFHRENRRGFKGGAINDALKKIEGEFDLVAIFDADQRPVEDFFKQVLPYFKDPKVAMVQIPQEYSETYSKISQGARYQQEPFLRVIMRGRSGTSAFSLGSGSVFRISALRDVGYFAEFSITEDAATSVLLHEKGYKTVYADSGLIWYGEPPEDLASYLTQQSRWSFGYFQLLGRLLRSNLRLSVFFDYYSGFLYWLKEGPITLTEFLAPIIFLVLRIPIVKINPFLYSMLYFPYLLVTIALFSYSVRSKGKYGIKGFFYHQVVEYLSFMAITTSFISWLMRRKIPFKVTPKGVRRSSRNLRLIWGHLLVISLLVLSVILGILRILEVNSPSLRYAIAINVFWAAYQLPFLVGGVWFALSPISEGKEYVEVNLDTGSRNSSS